MSCLPTGEKHAPKTEFLPKIAEPVATRLRLAYVHRPGLYTGISRHQGLINIQQKILDVIRGEAAGKYG